MASKKVSPESRVMEYFQTAPLNEAELVLKLVNGAMKTRRSSQTAPVAVAPVQRRKHRKKTGNNATAAASATTTTGTKGGKQSAFPHGANTEPAQTEAKAS